VRNLKTVGIIIPFMETGSITSQLIRQITRLRTYWLGTMKPYLRPELRIKMRSEGFRKRTGRRGLA
jgi:hypothetical protein